MNQFTFTSKHKSFLIGMIALGVVCLGITWFTDDDYHTRFWSNVLHNSVFFTGLSFLAAFFIAACITAYAGWASVFKRVWEAFSAFLLPGLILMLIIALGAYLGWHHLYHWADAESVKNDPIMLGKSGFLNKNVYLLATLLIVGTWIFFASKFRSISKDEDENGDASFKHHRRLRVFAAIFLPIAGFSSAAIIWQWVMSVDAHWYSTLFAWYATISWFVAMICMTIMVLLYLKSKGYYESVTAEHMHDLGKFLFGFSVFWTYLWFSQFMLIWYGNIGEETVYFKIRMDEYPVLHYGNLILNFVLPFLILMRNDTKRKFGSLGIVALLVFFGHWWDFFQMLKPGILHTAHEVSSHGASTHGVEAAHHGGSTDVAHVAEHVSSFEMGFTIPGLLEIGTFVGFLGLFLYVGFAALSKVALTPKNDPYLQESLHHHV